MLTPVRQRADYIIDSTTFHTNAKLRSVLLQLFGDRDRRQQLQVNVQSFGYKYGLPLEADLVLDVRFLPNPFYKAELRQHNGLEEPVRDYLFQYEETAVFLSKLEDLLRFLLPPVRGGGEEQPGHCGGLHRRSAPFGGHLPRHCPADSSHWLSGDREPPRHDPGAKIR